MQFKRILPFMVLLLVLPAILWSQVTTSSLSGVVKTTKGDAMVGATVVATHEPTGTVYKTQSRASGQFAISNMNPGGPYTIVVSFLNYSNDTKSDVYLNLGETQKLDAVMYEKSADLGNVTVSGVKKSTLVSSRGGAETTISREKLENLPTIGRNLNDYLRAVPQARLTGANGDGITIAGQNNRYNSFFVDGALNNDAFGLAASGTNGGQTGTPPLSIDAIDQFQVVISPYDASLGNFTGGGINAITKSGTNRTQGSVYYFFRNQSTAGKTPTGDKELATRFADFTNKTYGFRVGGAIKKNKLFYFISAESQRDVRPQPFDVANGYLGVTKSPADIQRLIDTLNRRGGYNPGTYLDNPETVNADRIAAKIDWNISDRNKLSISHRYTKATRENTTASNSNSLNFSNNGVFQPNTSNSTSLELKSVVGRSSSNRLLITYNNVQDDRSQLGNPYPRITIFNNAVSGSTAQAINIGSDVSSTINLLSQKTYTLFDNFKFAYKKHNFNVGVEYEYGDFANAFIQRVWGEYQYNNIDDFYNNATPRQFRTAYSLIDGKATDATTAAARFKTARAAGFFNDEIRVNNNLTLNLGVRADYNKWLSNPATDPYANTVAIPAFASVYDMKGAQSGLTPNIPISVSPRVGFTLKVPEENVVVRGGFGYFTGRIPLVWPAGVYNNNGLFIGGFTVNSSVNAAALNTVRFRNDPFNQWTANQLGIGLNKGGLNLISEKFRNPRVFRTSLAVDKKFNDGWSTTVEGMFTKNVNEIYYTNLTAAAPIGVSATADSRVVYNGSRIAIPGGNPYDNAILLSNNDGQKGLGYNFTVTIDKKTRTGLNFNFNYTYGNSLTVNEGTSSVNLSQWQFMETVNGRNNITRSQSDFSAGHRIFAYVSKKFTYANKNMATTISMVYTGQSGQPFSYVYGGQFVRDDASVGGAGGNDLMFIPTSAQLNTMAFQTLGSGATAVTRAQQIAALETYISADKYLSSRRGQFAERNGSRLPFTHIVDLKIAQDFNIKVGKNRYQFQLTYDVFNFTNMLNRDWGRNYFLSNDQFGAVAFRGFTTAGNTNPTAAQTATVLTSTSNVPVYTFTPTNVGRSPWNVSTSAVPAVGARWISQLGVRFNFN